MSITLLLLECGQGISVSAVDWQQLPTARIWDQSNCFPLPALACSRATAFARPPSTFWSLARHLLFAVATARQVSSRCRHFRRLRYRRWQACLPAPASLASELAYQRLLAVAAACLPPQASPPLRLARPQLHVAGKPAPCCRQAVSPPPSPLAMYHEA